mmetsp:Transcript_23144/g.44071  ORF Transcript_23144/g.44071 Transcript_23144/m.44071 type:complete len:903 (+) Transcript_23144:231-2939(+)
MVAHQLTGAEGTCLLRISMPALELEIREDSVVDKSEESLKEWLWQQHQDALLPALKVERCPRDKETGMLLAPPPSYPLHDSRRREMLESIATVQRQFFQSESPSVVFGILLDTLLTLTESEYGFIGEVKHEADTGNMYLQTHAITNIAWNQATREFYESNRETGLKFTNLNSLFGTVMTSREPIIANEPMKHPKRAGVPPGHPPLNHFLGIPFFKKAGDMNGMVGISNKPGGYSQQDIDFLEPFTVTCSNLIQAYRETERNEFLINNLEESVKARTKELEMANASLEVANRQIKEASQMQLQHFACMSHEIRTPLNCIIGMSSVLKESKMTRMQEETMDMIRESGDLLVSILNDVLDFSKLETGNFEIEIKKDDLQQTLFSTLHSIETKAQDRRQKVRHRYDPGLPRFVHMDRRRVQQILFNLLGNAIKFSKEDSEVEFSVQYLPNTLTNGVDFERKFGTFVNLLQKDAPAPPIMSREKRSSSTEKTSESSSCPFPHENNSDVSAEASDTVGETSASACPFHISKDFEELTPIREPKSPEPPNNVVNKNQRPGVFASHMMRFTVKDYGKGIPKEDFEKIFIPFQQSLKNLQEDVCPGTGLGLAITHRLVTAMGGTISVDSEIGEWSEFVVEIPCWDKPADVAAISKKLQNCTALVVGVGSFEKQYLNDVFGSFQVNALFFDTMDDLKTSFPDGSDFAPGHSYICLFQEDAFEKNKSPFVHLSGKARTTMLTFGPKFQGDSPNHISSFEKFVPSALLEKFSELFSEQPAVPDTVPAKVPYAELRVLVAEDNEINQKVLRRMLTRLGVKHMDFAGNGRVAVDLDALNEYDLVLMDQQMPVMGGVEACRRILGRDDDRPKPKIVFVTAHVSPDFEKECLSAGSTMFLPKPFKLAEIEACFVRIFG